MQTPGVLERLAVGGMVLAALVGCAHSPRTVGGAAPVLPSGTVSTTAQSPVGTAPTSTRTPGAVLAVSCTPRGLSVAAAAVDTTAGGVRLRVATTEPGAWLGIQWAGGGQGDPVPLTPTTWTVPIPPGTFQVRCFTSARFWPVRSVTVLDPGRHWRTDTLAGLGCTDDGGQPSWNARAGPGRGPTARAAVTDVARHLYRLGEQKLRPGMVTVLPVSVGYQADAAQTWIISSAGRPYLTATVTQAGAGYTADPDRSCHRT